MKKLTLSIFTLTCALAYGQQTTNSVNNNLEAAPVNVEKSMSNTKELNIKPVIRPKRKAMTRHKVIVVDPRTKTNGAPSDGNRKENN